MGAALAGLGGREEVMRAKARGWYRHSELPGYPPDGPGPVPSGSRQGRRLSHGELPLQWPRQTLNCKPSAREIIPGYDR